MNYADELYGFVRRHQWMPTFRELMTLWNYKTKSAVDYRVKKLLAAGLIEKEGRRLLAKRSGLALARSADSDEPGAADRS